MIAVIDFGSKKTPFITEIVHTFSKGETIGYNDVTEEKLAKFDAVIFSGSPIFLSEISADPYLEKINFLFDETRPILGICFGHQLLGVAFGATAKSQREDRDWQTIEILEECILFKGLEPIHQMMEDHRESISVPPGFVLAATSDITVNEAMFHKEKPFFGVQFHPEVSGENGLILLKNFIDFVQNQSQK